MKLRHSTITQQLIGSLFLILLLAQLGNMLILVNTRQLTTRSKVEDQLIPVLIDVLQRAPFEGFDELPQLLPTLWHAEGLFFLSKQSIATECTTFSRLPKFEEQLKTAFRAESVGFLAVTVRLDNDRKKSAGQNPGHPCGPETRLPRRQRGAHPSPLGEFNIPPPRGEYGRPPSGPPPSGPPPSGRAYGPPSSPPPPGFRSGPSAPPMSAGGGQRGPAAPGRNFEGMQEFIVSIEVEKGLYLNALVPHFSISGFTSKILISTTLLLILTLGVTAILVRRIILPLRVFTEAANKFGRGEEVDEINETGPADISIAAKAFNRMQRRLSRTFEGQRTMLRAVSHDIRTPLSSLRIRAESIEDETLRNKIISTVEDMSQMSQEMLSWTKDISASEEKVAVSLPAFMDVLICEYQDQGLAVTLAGDVPDINVRMRRVAVKRSLENIIGNALKYGKLAKVSVFMGSEHIHIITDDEGPGIPEDVMEETLKPFVRLEKSRNKDSGGMGLGLSITDMIIQTEGGRMTMTNQNPGLRVDISLPL